MSSTINASTAGIGGVITTADASGVLQLQTGGTAAITIDASQNVTFAGSVNAINNFAFKNLLIDAGFTINQRAYVSAAALASGAYGHDRWKAGASGGDYSFTQNASSTTITISSGKSLIQVVEDKNVNGTSYVLSWTGTALARYAVNSATPAGSFATSPILITGQTAGTTMSVEFNNGTLTTPQLEKGSVATSFDYRPYGTELSLCQRYYQVMSITGIAMATAAFQPTRQLIVTMRTSPTIGITGSMRRTADGVASTVGALVGASGDAYASSVFFIQCTPTPALVVGSVYDSLGSIGSITASAEL